MSTSTQDPKADTSKPTTFRLNVEQVEKLDQIRETVKITRNGLAGLALDFFLDFVERTGKLPAPRLRKARKEGK